MSNEDEMERSESGSPIYRHKAREREWAPPQHSTEHLEEVEAHVQEIRRPSPLIMEVDMGTWSHEPFGNDTANDWADDLESQKDFSFIEETLQRVLDNGDEYLEADLAVEGVAAIEVLAKAVGRGTQADAYTEKVDAWLKSISARPTQELLSKAKAALARILGDNSELKELWQDSDDFESWESSLRALQSAVDA